MASKTDDDLAHNRRLFAANVKRRDDRVDLALACLQIAKGEYPRLPIEDYLLRLEQLATELQVELDPEAEPKERVRSLSAFMSEAYGFSGNFEDYYDPR